MLQQLLECQVGGIRLLSNCSRPGVKSVSRAALEAEDLNMMLS